MQRHLPTWGDPCSFIFKMVCGTYFDNEFQIKMIIVYYMNSYYYFVIA